MLASTVQFSRNAPNQPPPPAPGKHPGTRKPEAGPPEANPPHRGAGSLRTQQRARPAPAPQPAPRPRPQAGKRVLAGPGNPEPGE